MPPKTFKLAVAAFVVVVLLIRIRPLFTNGFYFTTDQGRDAVYAREILAGRLIPLVGPQTTLAGIYHGALWYYFVAFGLLIFHGHPFGPVFLLGLIQLVSVLLLVFYLGLKLTPGWGIAAGTVLLTSWGIYDTGRYAFNPFLLVPITIVAFVIILHALSGRGQYAWISVPIGLTIHAHAVAAVPIIIWSLCAGIYMLLKRRTTFTQWLLGIIIIPLFFVPHLLYEMGSGNSELSALVTEFTRSSGYFSVHVQKTLTDFGLLLGESVLPQMPAAGALVFSLSLVLAFVLPDRSQKERAWTVKHVLVLALSLFIFSLGWYLTNSTWKPWQTVYLPPILLLSFVISLYKLPTLIAAAVLVIVLAAQVQYSLVRITTADPADASLVINELKSLDWVYEKSGGSGFAVYIYDSSVLDYTYQYLIPWYGLGTYGYLPCEYSSYPGSPKVYFPGASHYREPKKSCTDTVFLIRQPDREHAELSEKWHADITGGMAAEDSAQIGSIKVEKIKLLTAAKNRL